MLAPLDLSDQRNSAIAAELARADFYFFERLMFLRQRGYHWLRGRHHHQVAETLMRVFTGECRRLIINVPPRYSKTQQAVVDFMAWALGHVPDSEFIHASYSATLAGGNAARTRDLVMHEAYREIFPDVQVARAGEAHWTTTAGGVVYAAGAAGSITGFGAGKQRPGFGGAIIVDDPHKPEEARSDKIREGVIDWFQSTLESRQNSPHTPIIVIMQRLHQQDLCGWLLGGGNGEEWEHLCLSALTPEGEALWPAKHTAETLRRMEKAAPYMFAGQYRQSPTSPAGNIFTPDQMPVVDAIPAGPIRWVRGWDLSASLGGDWTVGLRLGRLADGRYIVADVVRVREMPHERDATLKNTADRDGRGTRISLPQDPGQAGKTQALALVRMLEGHAVTTSPETGDKVTRAEPFAAQVNVGNVLMLRATWNSAFVEELRLFPNGAFDDQVDAGSRAFEALMGAGDGAVASAGKVVTGAASMPVPAGGFRPMVGVRR